MLSLISCPVRCFQEGNAGKLTMKLLFVRMLLGLSGWVWWMGSDCRPHQGHRRNHLVVPFWADHQVGIARWELYLSCGSPWVFHGVSFSFVFSFDLLVSFLEKFLFVGISCLLPNFICFILIDSCVEEACLFFSSRSSLQNRELAIHGHLVES